MQLRPYQAKLKSDIYSQWGAGHRNIMAVSPTGSGKTVIFASIAHDHVGYSMLIAHRQELVSQISLALGNEGVYHRIVAPDNVIKQIERTHIAELGHCFHNTSAKSIVAGVDTLLARKKKLTDLCAQITLCIQDEGHHVLADNKWGKAAALLPNAKGLLVTATPCRADGKGLGRHADGIADVMVLGPSMRGLIDEGHLTGFQIYAPGSDIDIDSVDISKTTGDYNKTQLRKAAERSHIVGDIVEQYLKIAPGKQGITFVTDVKIAEQVAQRYNDAGVPAVALSAKSDSTYRQEMINRFRRGEILQLVNVDLFGEGFDVPAVEVVSMARHTASFSLFVQQAGRALRKFGEKKFGIIIDHVSNVKRHARVIEVDGELIIDLSRDDWTLDRQEKRGGNKSDDDIPIIECPGCSQPFPATFKVCPHCGRRETPALPGAGPKEIKGDLTELSPQMLMRLTGEVQKIDVTASTIHRGLIQSGMHSDVASKVARNHQLRQIAQGDAKEGTGLRGAIAYWAGYQRAMGRVDSESYRRFFFKFNIDVMSAQTLNTKDTKQLEEKVRNELAKLEN